MSPGLPAGAGAGPAAVPIVVHGGPGGTAARLDDLDAAGARLRGAAGSMSRVALRLARIAADPTSALTVARSPGTWWVAERRLARALAGPCGVVAVAARYTALGAATAAATRAYRAADATADAAVHAADAAAGAAAGRFLALPALATAAAAMPALVLTGVPVPAAGHRLADLLAAHPGLVEHAVDGVPGALDGLVLGSPLMGLLAGLTGRPAVPPDLRGAAGVLGSLGARTPWLREGGQVALRAGPARAAAPARGLAELVSGVGDLDPAAGAPPGTVRVTAVARPGGVRAWVVQIPGTQAWTPLPGAGPLDLSGNVHALAGEPTAGTRTVAGALGRAGARPGEPVLLVGHSQGGMIAAQLAGDDAFRRRFTVTHVVTAGSPIATAPIPAGVQVLSLEHDHDLVPRLDGAANPDRPGWITVSAPAEAPGRPPDAAGSHEVAGYGRTAAAVDASADDGLRRWRSGLAPFLAGDGATGTATLVTGERVLPAAPGGRDG